MCGIAGLWTESTEPRESLAHWGDLMSNALRHRGPDDGGIWIDQNAGVVLTSSPVVLTSGAIPLLANLVAAQR